MEDSYRPTFPLYKQAAQHIEKTYVNRAAEHSALPTERALQEELAVSRDTVRRALSYLTDRGLIYTRAGAGSFVAPRFSVHKTPRLSSFTEDMTERGYRASSEVLSCGLVSASEQVAFDLRLPADSEVFEIVRLRRADETPMAYERAYLLQAPFRSQPPDPAGSLDQQLIQAGFEITTATQNISAVALEAQVAMLLRQPLSAPGLRVFRVGYTEQGRPVEATETIYRSDRYDFELQVKREKKNV